MSSPQLARLHDALAEAARNRAADRPDNNRATVRASDLRYLLSQYDSKLTYCKQLQARVLEWQGRHAMLRLENNALRRAMYRHNRRRERKDMALLIARLAHQLEKANPDSDLPAKAVDYLRRKNLLSPLR